jgi:hypothetical protein
VAISLPADGSTSWGDVVRASIQAANASYGADHGFLTWSVDASVASSSTAPTAGVLNLVRVRLPVAGTVTNVCTSIGTAGASLTASYAGLYTASGTRVGVTADQSTSWTSGGYKEMALSSTYSAAAGLYYVGLLVGTATTVPAFSRSTASASANAGLAAPNLRFATSGTGLTALPASVTMSGTSASSVGYFVALT